MLDIVSIIFDKTPDQLAEMPIMDFSNLCGQVQFLNTPPKARRIKGDRIKIGSWDLQITPTINRMQTNQYIDFQTFVGQGEKGMAAQLSCFLVPVGCKYCDGYDVEQLKKDLGDMPTQTATDLIAFFLRKLKASIEGMLIYLVLTSLLRKDGRTIRRKIRTASKTLAEAFNKIGDGYTL